MTGRVLVPGVPHKPQGDLKSEVLSLHGGLLPKIEALIKLLESDIEDLT